MGRRERVDVEVEREPFLLSNSNEISQVNFIRYIGPTSSRISFPSDLVEWYGMVIPIQTDPVATLPAPLRLHNVLIKENWFLGWFRSWRLIYRWWVHNFSMRIMNVR